MKLYKRAAVICALLGLSVWNVALADLVEKEIKTPFDFPIDTCDETVYLEGWFTSVLLVAVDGNGGEHYISQLTAHGTGVGQTSGVSYVWNDSYEHIVENYTSGGTEEGNYIERTNLISKGPMDNPSFWISAHYTITPDGQVILDRFEPIADCLED
jgi:hypothetical protein